MSTDEFVRRVLLALGDLPLPYMIVGSVALNFYCVPRATQDTDIVVQANLKAFLRELNDRLTDFRIDPQLEFEGITATKKALLRLPNHDFHVEVFELGDDEYDRERFSRRMQVKTLGVTASIATPEDMLITKLRWSQFPNREKDISDARNLISVQGDTLDWPYVRTWSERHGTEKLLDRLRSDFA